MKKAASPERKEEFTRQGGGDRSPVERTVELTDGICERIAEGESLRAVLRSEGMPSKSLFLKWVKFDDELRDQYARAMDERHEAMFEDLQVKADAAESECRDMVALQARRLALDQGKWSLARMAPKKYGDKQTVAHEGSLDLGGLSDEELKAKLVKFGITG